MSCVEFLSIGIYTDPTTDNNFEAFQTQQSLTD